MSVRGCRPAPTESKHASRCATFNASEPHLQLLGGFAGRTGPKRHNAPAFLQVVEADSEQPPSKTAQKSRTMAKSTPISCETVQISREHARGRSRGNRQRRCERKPRHRKKHTSIPCSPVPGAENGLAAPPPGAATRDPHPARHLAQPAGKAAGVPPRGSGPSICTGWTPPPC